MTDATHADIDLLRSMLAGDQGALDAFVDEYYPRLFRFAFPRLGSDREATQEIVQGTFEKVIPRLGRFRGEAALFSWLCSFCRYEIAAYWQTRTRRAPEVELVEDAPAVRAALESLSLEQASPEQELERKELARLVRVVLDHLPVHYGNALEWKYIAGTSVVQIAARLGLSEKAAESLLTRARRAFRDGFAELVGGQLT